MKFNDGFVYRLAARFIHFLFDNSISDESIYQKQAGLAQADNRNVSQRFTTGNM